MGAYFKTWVPLDIEACTPNDPRVFGKRSRQGIYGLHKYHPANLDIGTSYYEQCTVYNVHYTRYSVQCTLYTVYSDTISDIVSNVCGCKKNNRLKMYIQCYAKIRSLIPTWFTMYYVHWLLGYIHCIVYTVHCTLYIIHSTFVFA